MTRAFFIWLSENKRLRQFAEKSRVGQRVSSRFVAGLHVGDALAATEATNARGMSVSIDNLGENVRNPDEAKRSAALYHELLDRIAERKANANVSVKLTHMGLDVDEALPRKIVNDLVAHAARIDNFVRIDMEGSPYTDKTLAVVRELHGGHPGRVGAVIQAYLRRSEADVRRLCAEGIRIRLCKGAYKEPPEIAFQEKSEVDKNYVHLMKMLLKSGIYHGIATHDESIIQQTKKFAQAENIPPSTFEFQMVYGIRRDLQEQIVKEGWAKKKKPL